MQPLILLALLAAPSSAEDLEFFEKRVRPVLVERCFECHSGESDKLQGNLRLDSREAVLAGGDIGAAAVPADPEKSLLVEAVRYTSESIQMPPTGKLPADEIAILEEWVRRGLPFPATETGAVARRTIDI